MYLRSQLASMFLALVLATPAIGVERLPEGVGDTLLFPFYTTENGLDTYINISMFTYDTSSVPILRVRFLDAVTTEVVNSFNVYPDRYENWQAALTFDEFEDRVELRLSEGSCTLDEDLNILRAGDDVGIGASVGMIEVYALGSYPADGLESDNEARCDLVAERWAEGGVWDVDPLEHVGGFSDFEPEAGVLMGEAWLVNVSEGFAASYTPITLRDLQEAPVHTHPRSPSPNLAEADPVAVIDGMDVIPPSGEGIDAIAMVLPIGESYALVNDVITSNVIGARTDWVISYPLAPYKNYKPFELSDGENISFCEGFGDRNFGPEDTTVASYVETRSGGVWTWGLGESNFFASPFSPAPPPGPEVASLCQPINVVAFGGRLPIVVDSDSPLLAEEPDPMMPSPDDGDSITLNWSPVPQEFPEESGIRRPIFAFRLTTFINGTLNDGRTLANYAVLRKHQTR